MLVVFGLVHLLRRAPERGATYARPVVIGIVHGLAGSASIALLAATTIHSRAVAVAYLGLFGASTVAGMVLLTMALAWPLAWTNRLGGGRLATAVAASLSIGLGLLIAIDTLGAHS